MKAITILRRCRTAKEDIERLAQRIAQRHDVLTALSAPQADPNGVIRGGGGSDKMGRIMGDIDQLEREKTAREDAEQAEKMAACALMDMVPDLEGKILYAYYVRCVDTGEIARKEKYTPGYVRKTKRRAEQLLEMISEERVNALLPPWYLREYEIRGGKSHGQESD